MLKSKLIKKLTRKPDVVINVDVMGVPYLSRWYVIPRNRIVNVYLHKFERSDDDMLHDHPWYSLSFLLKGEMLETSFKGVRHIPRFIPVFRSAKFAHRLDIVKGPVYTMFVTGPVIRSWGFYSWDKTWFPWKVVDEHRKTNFPNGF